YLSSLPSILFHLWRVQKSLRLLYISGYRRIHNRYPYIPISTIQYTVKKESERRVGISKPRSRRPKKLTKANKDQILNAIHRNPKIIAEDLLTKVNHKRPFLKEEHAVKRLRWALHYRHFTPKDWAYVFWSNKCTIKRDNIKDYHTEESNATRYIGLIPLFGNPKAKRTSITSLVIKELYRRVLPILLANLDTKIYKLRPNLLYIQNNNTTKEILVSAFLLLFYKKSTIFLIIDNFLEPWYRLDTDKLYHTLITTISSSSINSRYDKLESFYYNTLITYINITLQNVILSEDPYVIVEGTYTLYNINILTLNELVSKGKIITHYTYILSTYFGFILTNKELILTQFLREEERHKSDNSPTLLCSYPPITDHSVYNILSGSPTLALEVRPDSVSDYLASATLAPLDNLNGVGPTLK
ncbi:uncharacterized protein N7500_008443, partial [Penicillium coprophilum]|uniref:uncharacterized protein n=1 Tax=Penicillium coprophilum TaxID=36646 RepID=UPI00239DB7D8